MKIGYFAHNLNDPAVERRVRMLRAGGAEIVLFGFSRAIDQVAPVEGIVPVVLGRTSNARFGQRLAAVARALPTLRAHAAALRDVDVLLARQLEMLALACWFRRKLAPSSRVVYECLDIHRLMVSPGVATRALRALEGRLLLASQGLLVSSPAFLDNYFARHYRALPPVMLIENRVLASELPATLPLGSLPTSPPVSLPGKPWRIGWFGVLRCRRSLHALAALARRYPGQVEIVLRGRPALDAIPDFHAVVDATPGMRFHGGYDRSVDLAQIYGELHFAWAIDFFEAGANSEWLLPNRLYEGPLHGAVPLALASVETGRWLRRHDAGVLLGNDVEAELLRLFADYTPAAYLEASASLARIPREALVFDDDAGKQLVSSLAQAGETAVFGQIWARTPQSARKRPARWTGPLRYFRLATKRAKTNAEMAETASSMPAKVHSPVRVSMR